MKLISVILNILYYISWTVISVISVICLYSTRISLSPVLFQLFDSGYQMIYNTLLQHSEDIVTDVQVNRIPCALY